MQPAELPNIKEAMNRLTDQIFWDTIDLAHVKVLIVRLVVAALLGGMLGLERQHEKKSAGLRTHMLVALGAALFVVAPLLAGMGLANIARIIQGLTMGIGFLGAGVILKREEAHRVQGLTTAANIWLTAATGMAVGIGYLWSSIFVVCLALLILFILGRFEKRMENEKTQQS